MVCDGMLQVVSDEQQMACHMAQWLVKLLMEFEPLNRTFSRVGDSTQGDARFWLPFRTILVELLLHSQQHLRQRVYLNESSAVSLRDMRKACNLIRTIFIDFWRARVDLQPEVQQQYDANCCYFHFLTASVHCGLVITYCLRLDFERRSNYLTEIHSKWNAVRQRFPTLHPNFMASPAANPASANESELYRSLDDLARFVLSGIAVDPGIAPNQALKENTLTMLLAIYLKETLFIVGRPGSTKSRALELLCRASSQAAPHRTILTALGLVIQKHVVQCSPYTTSFHVNSQARLAALSQIKNTRLHADMKHRSVLVLEEVGATIGSQHNPLMSLHGLIDHGMRVRLPEGEVVERIAICGVSNYRLDASKMGRGCVVYRGNPTTADLEMTAKTILRNIDDTGHTSHLERFARAFSGNVLYNDELTWYHGMRDFYGSITTMQRLASSLVDELGLQALAMGRRSQMTSHVARWTVLINLRGFPERQKELELARAMVDSFLLRDGETQATWEWRTSTEQSEASVRLCDACCRLQFYRKILAHRVDNPGEEITDEVQRRVFGRHASRLTHGAFPCEFFNEATHEDVFAAEVIAFSLWVNTARHPMIFTQANAALSLLASLKLVRIEQCTVIFHSSVHEHATTKSELVQQMMRIRACMREGQTLILVRSRHIYESLLDALNGHYIRDTAGENDQVLYRTMLSLAGETKSVFIQPSFRCIVLESQEELKDFVLPPFINRFAKTKLTYTSALTPAQRALSAEFQAKSRVNVTDIEPGAQATSLNVLHVLIPGFADTTLDSGVHTFGEDRKSVV